MIGHSSREWQESARVIPDTKLGDALQMAISAAHGVDYPDRERAVVSYDSFRHDFCDVTWPTQLMNWIWKLKN